MKKEGEILRFLYQTSASNYYASATRSYKISIRIIDSKNINKNVNFTPSH